MSRNKPTPYFNARPWLALQFFPYTKCLRLGGKRGYGVPKYGVRGPVMWKTSGVESTGSGEYAGSKWKTRDVSGKHGVPSFFRQNMNYPPYNSEHFGLKRVCR